MSYGLKSRMQTLSLNKYSAFIVFFFLDGEELFGPFWV